MSKVIRKGIDASKGHCYPPKVCLNGSQDVLVNNIPIVRVGDNYGQKHTCGDNSHSMGPATGGSSNVFANGKKVHRNGDSISCGDKANNGSNNVFCN